MLAIINPQNGLVTFENTAISGQNQGVLNYEDLTNVSGNNYTVVAYGLDVNGNEFNAGEINVTISGDINPTTVFWAIAAVIKETLCPECV